MAEPAHALSPPADPLLRQIPVLFHQIRVVTKTDPSDSKKTYDALIIIVRREEETVIHLDRFEIRYPDAGYLICPQLQYYHAGSFRELVGDKITIGNETVIVGSKTVIGRYNNGTLESLLPPDNSVPLD